MDFKDYYTIMGVARDATQDDIKRAYRRFARKYHPDVSKEADAEVRFKELGEAYEVLKDPEKRAAYDQLGSGWREGQEFRPPPASSSPVAVTHRPARPVFPISSRRCLVGWAVRVRPGSGAVRSVPVAARTTIRRSR